MFYRSFSIISSIIAQKINKLSDITIGDGEILINPKEEQKLIVDGGIL